MVNKGTDELFLFVMSVQCISIVHHVIALSSKLNDLAECGMHQHDILH